MGKKGLFVYLVRFILSSNCSWFIIYIYCDLSSSSLGLGTNLPNYFLQSSYMEKEMKTFHAFLISSDASIILYIPIVTYEVLTSLILMTIAEWIRLIKAVILLQTLWINHLKFWLQKDLEGGDALFSTAWSLCVHECVCACVRCSQRWISLCSQSLFFLLRLVKALRRVFTNTKVRIWALSRHKIEGENKGT